MMVMMKRSDLSGFGGPEFFAPHLFAMVVQMLGFGLWLLDDDPVFRPCWCCGRC